MTTDTHTQNESTVSKPSSRLLLILYGVITLLVLGVGYLLYRNTELVNEFGHERDTLRATVKANQLANDQQQLTFGMKTFVWAVRNAMLQNKPGEINEYFNTLVKDRGVQEMLLVDPAGKVTISTNKKNQGIAFTSRFPAYLLKQQDIYFNDKKTYELSAPVMSTNNRLGTVVMFYRASPILPVSSANP